MPQETNREVHASLHRQTPTDKGDTIVRPIKFRAWDENNRVMHHNFQWFKTGDAGNDWIVFSSDRHPHKTNDAGLLFDDPFFSQQLKIMQYTGLKDKNGTEIYEGDVVNFNKCGTRVDRDGRAEDYHEKVRRQFVVEDIRAFNSFIEGQSANGGWWQAENLEVIGNVHENPELLGTSSEPA